MTIPNEVIKEIIRKLLRSADYRIEVVAIINAEFLQFAVDFFKKVVSAKLQSENISVDWYKQAFLDAKLPADEIAINAGLNKKTIHNMYNSARKEIVINAANEHYDTLYQIIDKLVESDRELELTLTIKFKNVAVELNISESLIIINTLAVKRAALRGGAWSTVGKQVEKKLMLCLCKLYGISADNYETDFHRDRSQEVDREIDFYLKNGTEKYRCEVKLMGKGNPESADAIFARESNVFVADKLSDQNKAQAETLGVHWVELHSTDWRTRFKEALEKFNIPYTKNPSSDIDRDLEPIFDEIFKI